MSHRDDADPVVRWWMSQRVVATLAMVIIVVVGLVGFAVWRWRLPGPPDRAAPDPSPTSSAAPTLAPGPLPPTGGIVASSTSAPGGQQGAPPAGSSPKPVVTGFSVTYNGMIVTVSFTFTAQADRGPFTCSIRRASGTEEFSCDVGQVTRTYDYDFCCGSEVFVIVTDRNGVRSTQWDDVIEIPRPTPPTLSNLHGWHADGKVYVEWAVTSAPGDDPRCDVDVWRSLIAPPVYSVDGLDCEVAGAVVLDGTPGQYQVTIRITSDSHWNAPPPEWQPVTVA